MGVSVGVEEARHIVERPQFTSNIESSIYFVLARRPRFSEAQILDATATLVARGGTGAATIGAIGPLLDARSRSIQSRFASRDLLPRRLSLTQARLFPAKFA